MIYYVHCASLNWLMNLYDSFTNNYPSLHLHQIIKFRNNINILWNKVSFNSNDLDKLSNREIAVQITKDYDAFYSVLNGSKWPWWLRLCSILLLSSLFFFNCICLVINIKMILSTSKLPTLRHYTNYENIDDHGQSWDKSPNKCWY